jgi:hypothetical protein
LVYKNIDMIHYIKNAVSKGFDVEIDISYDILDKIFYLGYDKPQHIINWFWMAKYKNYLWVHCKNIESFFEFIYKVDIDGKVSK